MTNADRATAAFHRHFGTAPDGRVRAPGRVNLIGEHTDYNDGFVLPCAIDRGTVVAFGPSDAGQLEVVAVDFDNAVDRSMLSATFQPGGPGWADYVRGMATALIEDGIVPGGARLAIAGDVPMGSGLSASAALEIAVGNALARIAGRAIDPTLMARIAQRAENDYAGCDCGIMDQLISARGIAGHALLIDCRSLDCRPVALPAGVAVLIAHSGVRHAHAGGAYNDRRRQCEAAARHYGVPALRDLDVGTLAQRRGGLDDIAFRRARHVVTENARTLAAAAALERGDLSDLGRLMHESHASMRDDFEITVPAIDRLAAIMGDAVGSEGGARMTGGGFGGCVVALAPEDRVAAVRAAVADGYRAPDGKPAEFFVCRAVDGAGPVEADAAWRHVDPRAVTEQDQA